MGIGLGLHLFNLQINLQMLTVEKINAEGEIESMGGVKPKLIKRDHQAKSDVVFAEE